MNTGGAAPTGVAEFFLGLISGTSMDGVDAALVAFDANGPVVHATTTTPYPDALRERLLAAIQPAARMTLHEYATLDIEVGRHFAGAALALLHAHGRAPDTITALGSHGQTLRHHVQDPYPYSVQIGDPATVAARTGITTVADFRSLDIALGGQGAPLVPPFHARFLGSPDEMRVVVNIGGIANLTLLPAGGRALGAGFDTGPGNCLLDEWVRCHHGHDFDADGQWAASGRVEPALLARLLEHPFCALAPPKSTGRETFNLSWVRHCLADRAVAPADVQATLCAFTVETVARAVEQSAHDAPLRVLVCGGGARNRYLMETLATRLAPRPVGSTAAHGIDPDYVEAAAFAWLARQRVHGEVVWLTTNKRPTPRHLGVVYEPRIGGSTCQERPG